MKRARNLLRGLLPVVVLVASAWGAKAIVDGREVPEPTPPEEHVPLVRTIVAEAAPAQLAVEAQGTVLPRTETVLKSEVAARVVELSPRLAAGGFFEQGEVLVRLDDTDLELASAEARTAVARAELRVAQEEADAAVARRDWQALGRSEEPPPLVVRVPQLEAARAELASARAALAKAERDVERTRVRAPYDGRVLERVVDVGQFVDRGASLATVYAVDYAEVRLPIPDRDLALLELERIPSTASEEGQGPSVTLRARFARNPYEWQGTIVRTEGMIDPVTRSVVLVARVDDPYGPRGELERPPLLAGMFVHASVEGRALASAVRLPREALRSEGRVFVLEDGGLAFRAVEIHGGDRDSVLVTDGLEGGEHVVLSPIELPVEGMRLREEASER